MSTPRSWRSSWHHSRNGLWEQRSHSLTFCHLPVSPDGTVMLCRRFPEDARPAPWQIALAMIFCLPMFLNTLTRGQFGIISLFFEAAIFYNYLKQQKILIGLLLAFAVALKISPLAFLFFFFLMKREWKILLSTIVGFGLFFFLLPSLVIGFHQNWELLKIWRGLMSISQSDTAYQHYLWGELFTPFAEDNQSIYAVITRFVWPSEAPFIGHSNAHRSGLSLQDSGSCCSRFRSLRHEISLPRQRKIR